jgi:hypothetical protein
MKKTWTILVIIYLSLSASISVLAESFQGVKYTVLEKSNLGSIKFSIDIRLEKKVSKGFLQAFALKLREDLPRKYDRLFITDYLPGMSPETSDAWATSHFNPALEVKILGSTIEEEQALKKDTKNISGEIIGEWLDESPYVAAKYTLIRKNETIIMEQKFSDGSTLQKVMVQNNKPGIQRFEEITGNDFGEYYLIEKNGDLGVYDNECFIKTMPSIKKENR